MNVVKWRGAFAGLIVALLITPVLQSQPPDRGGRDRGGRDRGGPPGMMRGGPPEGSRGGSFGGPMSFLERMDANHNGMLDPSETQGRARSFLESIAKQSKLDLSKPIKLDKIAAAFEKMRESRSSSGDRSRGGDDRGRGNSSSSVAPEALVPGFGEPLLFDPVPGFGTLGEQYAVKIEDSDRREAEQTLNRYDQNHDSVLDKNEISRGRWTEDALKTDRNHDGKLSLNELALRYAMRRAAREGSSSRGSTNSRTASSRPSSSGRSSGPSSRSSQGSSSSNDARMEMMARMMMSRYDTNKNGVLEKDEWKQFRTDPSAADTNRDGKITSSELGKWMASRMASSRDGSDRGSSSGRSGWYANRDDANKKGDKSDGNAAGSDAGSLASAVGKRSRLHTATELLPEGLPEWFAQRDANADGQVRMHEFSTSWSAGVVADFTQFDRNGDGVITPQECLQCTQAGAVLGSPSSAVLASTSSSSSMDSTRRSTLASSTSTPSTPSADSTSGSSTNVTSKKAKKYISYAVGNIKRYDTNHDGVLVKDEWSKMSKDYSAADADGDGKITPKELAEFLMKG